MIVLLGSAGAGKSVQSQLLCQDFDYQWVSTGMLLRAHTDSSLKTELNKGSLITDEVVTNILSRTVLSYANPSKVVIDGFPRKTTQAEWLIAWARSNGITLELIAHLIVSPEVARERLRLRQRADDTEEATTKRFKEYQTATMAILEIFKQAGVPILDVDANGTIEEVHQNLSDELRKIQDRH